MLILLLLWIMEKSMAHEELLKNNAIYQEVYEIQNRIGKVGE